jgi:hypothetical protein
VNQPPYQQYPPAPGEPWQGAPQQQWQGQAQQQWQGVPGQQWQGAPQAALPPRQPGPTVATHLKRAFDWNVASMGATPREQEQLAVAGIEPRLHGLYVWRRSTLLVALPVLLLSVVLNFVQAADRDTTYSTDFGKFLIFLPPIALTLIPLGATVVVRNWTRMRGPSRTLLVCWVISIAIPMFVALMPLQFTTDLDKLKLDYYAQYQTLAGFNDGVLAGRLQQAIYFALVLLPVVLSVPGGVLKGAGRVKSLFPSAVLPGWFLVAVAPFYSMFMIVVFVLIDQAVGNGLLLVGVGLLAFTPWLFVINRRVYGRPLTVDQANTELARASRWGGWLTTIGIGLVAIFVFTQRVAGTKIIGGDTTHAVFTYVQVLRTVGEVLSRGLATAVVFSTIFLYAVYAEWRLLSTMRGDLRREYDAQVGALERYMTSRAAPYDPAQAPPAS